MDEHLLVSVVIPVHNASAFLERCLAAVAASCYPHYEVIVVDDGSTDDSVTIARNMGITAHLMQRQAGPAAARNYGAKQAHGDILFFVDSDVLIQGDTIQRIVHQFLDNPKIGALFGSYDDAPAESNFWSQYKNLHHHYVHQQASPIASTFWTGCGAVWRDVFHEVGGFDSDRYPKPSIEDIEFGQRLMAAGHTILLDKTLQVKHLKCWRFLELVRTDVFRRAVPWSRLILERQQEVHDLNLKMSDRISAGLVCLSVALLPLAVLQSRLLYIAALLIVSVAILNHRLYAFFLSLKGLGFTLLAFPVHLFYYLYSSMTYGLCWIRHQFRRRMVY